MRVFSRAREPSGNHILYRHRCCCCRRNLLVVNMCVGPGGFRCFHQIRRLISGWVIYDPIECAFIFFSLIFLLFLRITSSRFLFLFFKENKNSLFVLFSFVFLPPTKVLKKNIYIFMAQFLGLERWEETWRNDSRPCDIRNEKFAASPGVLGVLRLFSLDPSCCCCCSRCSWFSFCSHCRCWCLIGPL